MLADVRSGAIDTIISYSNSRLTRRPAEWIELIALAESGALQIETEASGKYDLTTAEGRALAITVAAWDAAEADRISERQKAAFLHNALAGKPKRQRQRAFGWEEDGITVRESEASLIREAVEELKAGASIATIQHGWNRAGVRTAVDPSQSKKETKPDGQWEWSVVHRVLLGWRTAGVRTYRREPLRDAAGKFIMGTWEPIISLEDREQALAMLQKRARTKRRQGSWPLSGFLRCGECAKPLYGQTPSGRRNRAMYACKSSHVSISAGLLEQYILNRLVIRLFKREKAGRELKPVQPKSALDWPKHKDLTRSQEKLARARAAWKSDKMGDLTAFSLFDELEGEIRQLERELGEFLVEEAVPSSPLHRTSEVLVWVQDFMGTFHRETPRKSTTKSPDEFEAFGDSSDDDERENEPWGGSGAVAAAEEETIQATPEDIEELRQILQGELEVAVIKKGVRGRTRQTEEAFGERINLIWKPEQ